MEGGSAAEGLLEQRPEGERSLQPEPPQEEAEALPGPQEEEETLPLAKRRKLLCAEFASITSSDLALARCCLADHDWHMQH